VLSGQALSGQVLSGQAPSVRAPTARLLPESETIDLVPLIGKVRASPLDPPYIRELTRWYLWSIGAFLGAGAIAALASLASRWARGKTATSGSIVVLVAFWSSALVLGLVSTPLANRWSEGFVFTWPVSVFVIHQWVLVAVVGSTRPSSRKLPDWIAPAAVLSFVAVCAVYYDLCRRLNLPVAWVFLAGLLPSWLLAVPLAYRFPRVRGAWVWTLWTMALFSLYFWAAAGWLWLREYGRQ
jgi:hypothetical protein